MPLMDRTAINHGGGDAIGSAVVRALAHGAATGTVLKRLPTLAAIANSDVFLAWERRRPNLGRGCEHERADPRLRPSRAHAFGRRLHG